MTDDVQTAPPGGDEQKTQPAWKPETETEARALGWKSPDEWSGDIPAGYIDNPERYLERAESFTPFRKVREKLEAVEKSADERLRKVEAIAARAVERQKADFDAQIAAIKAEKLVAVEEADPEKYKALERREEALIKAAPKEAADGVPADHRAAIEQWTVGKDWFRTDLIKTNAAVILYDQAQKSGMTDPKAILAFVDQELAKRFTDSQGNKQEAKAEQKQMVDPGLTFGGGLDASSFSKLPQEAKDSFARFVKQGLFQDTKEGRAAYAEDYNAA